MIFENLREVVKGMTVYARPKNKKRWIERGFRRMDTRCPEVLYNYWLKKLEAREDQAIALYNQALATYQQMLRNRAQGLGHQVKSAAVAAGKFIKSGMATVSEAQLEERMNICRACPEWDATAFANTGKCKLCGCATKAKLRMATEKCPINKWLPTIDASAQVSQ